MDLTAKAIIDRHGLIPHPEGGYYREIYRSPLLLEHPAIPADRDSRRCAGTLIYFLLAEGQISAFHRVHWTDEIWHLYAGGPLELHTIDASSRHTVRELTHPLERGEAVAVVSSGAWQAARLAPGASWAFGGCSVAPGFEFADFEMASAAALLEAHPAHAGIIQALTRA